MVENTPKFALLEQQKTFATAYYFPSLFDTKFIEVFMLATHDYFKLECVEPITLKIAVSNASFTYGLYYVFAGKISVAGKNWAVPPQNKKSGSLMRFSLETTKC